MAHSESSCGRMLGLFTRDSIPEEVLISPIAAIPKDENDFRIIHDLTYPKGRSINSCIKKDDISCDYPTTKDVVRMLSKVGQGAFLWKIDLKSAYR